MGEEGQPMKKPIIIDCDPGIDDAMAILIAVTHSELDVKLITTVAGNQTVDKTTKNALNLLSFLNETTIEVAKGADRPLIKPLVLAEKIHGDSGLGNVEMNVNEREMSSYSAVEAMKREIECSEDKVTIVAIGPLTNVALLLRTYPHLKGKIEEFSIMGGSLKEGNITAVAEFNFFVDPEAAQIVLNAGIPITLFGLNVTHKVPLFSGELDSIREIHNETSQLVVSMLEYYFQAGRVEGLHDPCAVVYLIDPEVFEFENYDVQVETKGELTAGMSVVDQRRFPTVKPNVRMAIGVNRDRLIGHLYESIRLLK